MPMAPEKYKIWVLAPHLQSSDPHLQSYYDFSQSMVEYESLFLHLDFDWHWQPVTIHDYKKHIAAIQSGSNGKIPLIFNLCDGDEINDVPGISVIRELERLGLPYTGADAFFYDLTTSKIRMKQVFEQQGIPTPPWEVLREDGSSVSGIFDRLGSPLIVKPAVSGGSMGLSARNVVSTEAECLGCLNSLLEGYRGWRLSGGGIFAEQFIAGREYTVFMVGPSSRPGEMIFYPPAERVFPEFLPETEQFLPFDGNWDHYENGLPAPFNGHFHAYTDPGPEIRPALENLSLRAYQSVGGSGYGRVDIRMDKTTGQLYVLEVNAQCGLSADESNASVGAILRFAEKSFAQLHMEIILDALRRNKKEN